MAMRNQKQAAQPITDEEIRKKAYQIWIDRGKQDTDTPELDWLQAKERLEREKAENQFNTIQKLGKGVRTGVVRVWNWTGLKEKKGWDFLQLLVVPVVLAGFGLGFQEFSKQRDTQQADEKAKQETLTKYLEEMSDLLNNGLLKTPVSPEKFIIAQTKTVIALQSVDARRQHLIIQFLEAANLNGLNKYGLLHKARMSKADLSNSDLSGAVLINADLSEAKFSCLRPSAAEETGKACSDLSDVNLSVADLSDADLGNANLNDANLSNANIQRANLQGTNLYRANLYNTDLYDADLSNANLSNANLSNSSLRIANVSNAFFDHAELSNASLVDADLSNINFSNADFNNADLRIAIVVGSDLRTASGLTPNQLEGRFHPLLCKVKLPQAIKIDPDRDCKRLLQELLSRYPLRFRTSGDVQKFIDRF